MKLSRVTKKLRRDGISPIIEYVNRNIFKTKTRFFDQIKDQFEGKVGLEIGGPSMIFKRGGYIPLYPFLKQVDGCNFTNTTVWEGSIEEGNTYNAGAECVGIQYIADSVDLSKISDKTYDFVLSSHSLEHIANPIKALKEWLRVLKKDGLILLILPDKRYTFDNKRPITKFEHLLEDDKLCTTEEDLTHLEEILSLHDLSRDEDAGTKADFRTRSLQNFSTRCLHHHVFDIPLLMELFAYLCVEICFSETAPPYHHIIMGRKK